MPRRPRTATAQALALQASHSLEHATWMDDAACLSSPRDLWYGHEHERLEAREARVAEARRICYGCAVRLECLETAIANKEPHGVWGGHTTSERRALVRFRSGE